MDSIQYDKEQRMGYSLLFVWLSHLAEKVDSKTDLLVGYGGCLILSGSIVITDIFFQDKNGIGIHPSYRHTAL